MYGSAQILPISEQHPLVAQSPYAATKIAADKLAESYHLSFDVPIVTARPFNTFGPRQTARAVIPTIASQLLSGKEEIFLGSLTPMRDFNYVEDTVMAIIALALCDEAVGQTVNIGSGKEWSIGDTVALLCEITGSQPKITLDQKRVRPENSEVNRLLADNSKLLALTDWRPKTNFKKGLSYTVEWIEKNMSYFDVHKYSR